MLKLKEGYSVPFPKKLYESYEQGENTIIANVGIDKLEDVVQHFIAIQNEPMFFILELPVNCNRELSRAATEEELIKIKEQGFDCGVTNEVLTTSHKDIYYIDGCSVEEAFVLFERVKDLLLADGVCQFGFGCHESHDEIMVQKYNIVTIYSENIRRYLDFYEAHDIPRVDRLLTAWDTFTSSHPGLSQRVEKDGKTVFDLPELLKEWGIYLAETVGE